MDWREQEIWDLRTEEIIQGLTQMLAAGSDYNFMRNTVPDIIRKEAKSANGFSEQEMLEKFGDLERLVDTAKERFDARR